MAVASVATSCGMGQIRSLPSILQVGHKEYESLHRVQRYKLSKLEVIINFLLAKKH